MATNRVWAFCTSTFGVLVCWCVDVLGALGALGALERGCVGALEGLSVGLLGMLERWSECSGIIGFVDGRIMCVCYCISIVRRLNMSVTPTLSKRTYGQGMWIVKSVCDQL